jgi:hypothetical protein
VVVVVVVTVCDTAPVPVLFEFVALFIITLEELELCAGGFVFEPENEITPLTLAFAFCTNLSCEFRMLL